MKVYFYDQKDKFGEHLHFLKKKSVNTYCQSSLIEKTTTLNVVTQKTLAELSTGFFFNYNIFPKSILTAFGEWESEKRTMLIGDTIVQQAYIPPFKHFSQKIIMGVRISAIINEPKRVSFSYQTLHGHIENGIFTFTIEEIEKGKIICKIHTFSKPQNLIVMLFSTAFSIPYQTFCTVEALKNVKKNLEMQ